MRSGAKVCTSCRSRQEHSIEYLLANFGVGTAENGPLKVCQKLNKSQKKARKKLEKPRLDLFMRDVFSCIGFSFNFSNIVVWKSGRRCAIGTCIHKEFTFMLSRSQCVKYRRSPFWEGFLGAFVVLVEFESSKHGCSFSTTRARRQRRCFLQGSGRKCMYVA